MTAADLAALILGPNGAVVVMGVIIYHLYRENTALREDAMDLLKKYQQRDDEERKLRTEEERERRRREVTT